MSIIRLKKSYFTLGLILILIVFTIISLSAFNIKAEESSSETYKYYTCIEIESGDSLWSIAAEYKTSEYSSIDEYIKEVKSINNMRNDEINQGDSLVIPYYSNELK